MNEVPIARRCSRASAGGARRLCSLWAAARLAAAALAIGPALAGAPPRPPANAKGHSAASARTIAVMSPFVLGFERVYRGSPGEGRVEGGLLLLAELGCTSCHEPRDAARALLEPKSAPRLREVAARADSHYLRELIAAPRERFPGGTMPALLEGLSPSERERAADSIVHYLVSRRSAPFRPKPPDLGAAARGERLYHQVGCVACHAPLDPGEEPLPASSKPFPALAEKYSHDGLRRFLRDPLSVRPAGRMPSSSLGDREASDIAHYLLRHVRLPGTLRYALYRARLESLDELTGLTPERTGLADSFDAEEARRSGDHAARFDGYLRIDRAGEYTFHLRSKDGSRLWLDGAVAIDNDGVRRNRAARSAHATARLAAGWHAVALEHFQRGREGSLELEWEGPGVTRGPVAPERLRATREEVAARVPWKVDPELALEGRERFVSLGCAACHREIERKTDETRAPRFAPLDRLDPRRGCLAEKPAGAAPRYRLDPEQRAALRSALGALREGKVGEPSDARKLRRALARFSCTACHERDGAGGVGEDRRPWFTATTVDAGDEGRLPPRLTGVGDKLRPEALEVALRGDGRVRPYMNTRMPRFPTERLAPLAPLFVELDRRASAVPEVSDPPEVLKEEGRKFVGRGRCSCITCHTFHEHRPPAAEAVDLVRVRERINEDWFHRYLREPARYRPLTRMPEFWPGGTSVFPDVLGGDPDRQISAIWSYLQDGERAVYPEGLTQKKTELLVGGEAIVYRGKIRDAGFRAICVGHPERVNLAFDAEEIRLALLWKGRFLDVTAHWTIQGMGRIGPRGRDVVRLAHGSELARLESPRSPWPEELGRAAGFRFRGYQLDRLRRPTFLYEYRGIAVEDRAVGFEEEGGAGVRREISLAAEAGRFPQGLWFRAAVGRAVEPAPGGLFRVDAELPYRLRIRAPGNAEPRVIASASRSELRVPVAGGGGRASLTIEYRWGSK